MSARSAFVFPGQGSQSIGMLSSVGDQQIIQTTFQEASDQLGYDLWGLVQNGTEEELNQTARTQPAMLTAGVAMWRLWRDQSAIRPEIMAGHSLGEYTALVAAGVLDFADAVALVEARGNIMQSAVPEGEGAMAAILGLDDDAVREVCDESAQGMTVSAVNFNSPGQVVIAGNTAAVERAMQLAKDKGAKRALKLAVSVPSHCELMKNAADQFAEKLNAVNFSKPAIAVLHNADVAAYEEPEKIKSALARQLHSAVRWTETVQAIVKMNISNIVECGPGKVLTGLNKRIDKSISSHAIYDLETLNAANAALAG